MAAFEVSPSLSHATLPLFGVNYGGPLKAVRWLRLTLNVPSMTRLRVTKSRSRGSIPRRGKKSFSRLVPRSFQTSTQPPTEGVAGAVSPRLKPTTRSPCRGLEWVQLYPYRSRRRHGVYKDTYFTYLELFRCNSCVADTTCERGDRRRLFLGRQTGGESRPWPRGVLDGFEVEERR